MTATRSPPQAAGAVLVARETVVGGRTLFWVESGDPEKRAVVFVHGTPGGWGAFRAYLGSAELLPMARLVSIDRPGWGRSGGETQTRLGEQAAAVAAVVDALEGSEPPILVGHSLGAPIVARTAMDFPEKVGGLVLVSPSIDPDLERLTWYQRLGRRWPWRRLLPAGLRTALHELVPLRDELAAMAGRWGEVRVPVTVVQGGRDRLVDPRNADFAERVVRAPLGVVRVPDAGHLIPCQRPELLVDAVRRQLAELDAARP